MPPRTIPGGYLVAFEGGENAGKSTQAKLTADGLRLAGYDVLLTIEPGGTRLGGQIRRMLLSKSHADMDHRAEALLYAADRAQHVATEITPAMREGMVVVTDRYTDSSVAYQGAGRLLGSDSIAQLNAWASYARVPDLTVLLDVTHEWSMARQESPPDRIEAEGMAFHSRVRHAFLDLACRNPHRYLVIDAAMDMFEIQKLVHEPLLAALKVAAEGTHPVTG